MLPPTIQSLRKDEGIVQGEILIDGRPLGASFQRTTAYVSQMDIHDPAATVREALIFSALLRQPRETPNAEKIAYVDTVIDLLELHDISDALIGTPGTSSFAAMRTPSKSFFLAQVMVLGLNNVNE